MIAVERGLLFGMGMRRRALSLLAAALVVAPTTSAFAAPSPPLPPSPVQPGEKGEPENTVWYGYKLMLADAASVALVFAGAGTEMGGLAMTGLGGVLLGAPVVHAVEGQGGRAAGSLALRVLLPLAGGALAAWDYDRGSKDGECDCMGGVLATAGGMVLGIGAAMLVDAVFLGWRSEAPATKERSLSLIPSVGVAPGGGSVGLAGRF